MRKYLGLMMCLVFLFQNSVCALGVPIKGVAEKYNGRQVGTVYINDKVVMRFYSPGEFQNPYRRARYTADLLIKMLNLGYDLKEVKVMKGAIATVGIAGNEEVFRIYEEDVLANNAVPESLATQWAKNIRDSIMISEIEIASEGKYLKAREEAPTRPREVVQKSSAEPTAGTQIVQKIIRNKPEQLKPYSPINVPFMVIVIAISLVVLVTVVLLLILQYRKLSLQKKGIVEHASGEELENLVSHLISELEERSAKITSEFQERVTYLESLLATAENTVKEISSRPAVEELPGTIVNAGEESPYSALVEPEVAVVFDKTSAIKQDEPPQQPAVVQRTKQEIIYELADQGRSVTDIAKHLGIGTGEVQLILDLKQ